MSEGQSWVDVAWAVLKERAYRGRDIPESRSTVRDIVYVGTVALTYKVKVVENSIYSCLEFLQDKVVVVIP